MILSLIPWPDLLDHYKRFNRIARHEWLDLHLLNPLSKLNYWSHSGFGLTIMNVRIQQLEAYRQDDY